MVAPPSARTLRLGLSLAGGALLVVAFAATPRSKRWDDTRPLFATPAPAPREARPEGPAPSPSPREEAPAPRPAAPRPPPPPSPPRPPDASERRVFGALGPGARVAGGEVTALEGLREGFLRVQVRLPEGPVEVLLAREAGTNAHPPVSAGPYALYCGQTPIAHATLEPVLRAIAAALVLDPALVPPGLRPLRAQESPR